MPERGKNRRRRPSIGLIIIFIILLFLFFFSAWLVEIVSTWAGWGSFTYTYLTGDETIISITYALPLDLAEVMIHEQVAGWVVNLDGNILSLTGGPLNPGESVTVDYRLARYIRGGARTASVTAMLSGGETFTTESTLQVPEIFLLNFFRLIHLYRFWFLILAVLVLAIAIFRFVRGKKIEEKTPPPGPPSKPKDKGGAPPGEVDKVVDELPTPPGVWGFPPPSEKPPTPSGPPPARESPAHEPSRELSNTLFDSMMQLRLTSNGGLKEAKNRVAEAKKLYEKVKERYERIGKLEKYKTEKSRTTQIKRKRKNIGFWRRRISRNVDKLRSAKKGSGSRNTYKKRIDKAETKIMEYEEEIELLRDPEKLKSELKKLEELERSSKIKLQDAKNKLDRSKSIGTIEVPIEKTRNQSRKKEKPKTQGESSRKQKKSLKLNLKLWFQMVYGLTLRHSKRSFTL